MKSANDVERWSLRMAAVACFAIGMIGCGSVTDAAQSKDATEVAGLDEPGDSVTFATVERGNGNGGIFVPPPPPSNRCRTDSDCDDGDFCNGDEECASGQCVPGEDPCPDQYCNEEISACEGFLCDGSAAPLGLGEQIGVLFGGDVHEASGLVMSRANPNVLWTHNDNYGDNRVFAINLAGEVLGEYSFGTGARDSEDIAIGPGPVAGVDYLYWGDIGDNDNVRTTIFVRRAPEPAVYEDQDRVSVVLSGVKKITLRYPTGTYAPTHKDAETLMVDPVNGDIYVITKRTTKGEVYRAAYPQSTTATITMQHVATIPWKWSTGGDISPDGSSIIVRRYSGMKPAATIWYRPAGTKLWDAFAAPGCNVPLRSEPQGEAICWDVNGKGFFTVSEDETPGALIPIWLFEVD